jgi:hypothetical protein
MKSARITLIESGIKIDSVQEEKLLEAMKVWGNSIVDACIGSVKLEDIGPEYADIPTWGINEESIMRVKDQIV